MLDTRFTFDNIDSDIMNVMSVNIESGFLKEIMTGKYSLKTIKTIGDYNSYLLDISKEPIEMDILIALKNGSWDFATKFKISEWLLQDNFKPLQFFGDDRVFYGIFVDNTELNHNGMYEGYLTLKFKTNSWHPWSIKKVQQFNLSTNVGDSIITLNNNTDINEICYPIIDFTLVGSTTEMAITNITDKGKISYIEGLTAGEHIVLNGSRKRIYSLPNNYNRLPNFNKNFLGLLPGDNQIQVSDKCNLIITYKTAILY